MLLASHTALRLEITAMDFRSIFTDLSFLTKYFTTLRHENLRGDQRTRTRSRNIQEDEACLIGSDEDVPQVSSRVRQRSVSPVSQVINSGCSTPDSSDTDGRNQSSEISGDLLILVVLI